MYLTCPKRKDRQLHTDVCQQMGKDGRPCPHLVEIVGVHESRFSYECNYKSRIERRREKMENIENAAIGNALEQIQGKKPRKKRGPNKSKVKAKTMYDLKEEIIERIDAIAHIAITEFRDKIETL